VQKCEIPQKITKCIKGLGCDSRGTIPVSENEALTSNLNIAKLKKNVFDQFVNV
jgi:hypothetical protein